MQKNRPASSRSETMQPVKHQAAPTRGLRARVRSALWALDAAMTPETPWSRHQRWASRTVVRRRPPV